MFWICSCFLRKISWRGVGGVCQRGDGGNWVQRCAWKICQMACKPGSVALLRALMAIHLERLPAVSSDPPGHDAGSHLNGALFACPYLVLLQMGFAMPVLLPGRRCALPHHFTLPRPPRAAAGGIFSVALSLGLPPPGVTRHPDPVEPGLSSLVSLRKPAAIRPSDRAGL